MNMKIKSFLARPFASYVYKAIQKGMTSAVADQEAILKGLLQVGSKTEFGTEHKLGEVKNHAEFREAVPVRDYEQFSPYISRIKEGRHNVLWKGLPIYFAKTSGTTSGIKYIPITKDSISNHIITARNALLCYMAVDRQYGVLRRENDLSVGLPGTGADRGHSHGPVERDRQPSYSRLSADQPAAVL